MTDDDMVLVPKDVLDGAQTMRLFEGKNGNGWWDGWYRVKLGLQKLDAMKRSEPQSHRSSTTGDSK